MKIYHTNLNTPLGNIIIASTDKGLLRISLRGKQEFFSWLEKKIKDFELMESFDKNGEIINQLKNYFNKTLATFRYKPHLFGTPFQIKVWKRAEMIPYGKTVSYEKIAEMVGKPKAVRAVGTALGENPIPIIIGCHRVIKKDGTLGGFSGGIEMKIKLLELEGVKMKK